MLTDKLRKADINIASSGNNTIITATAGKYIAIDHINFIPTTAVTVQLKDGSTNYGGSYPLDAKQGLVFDNVMEHTDGIITMSNGSDFVINLGSAVQVSGFVRYRIVG